MSKDRRQPHAPPPSPTAPPTQGVEAPTSAILESISDGVFTVDAQWRVTSFNRAAETITGIPRAEAIGRLCSEVFRSSMCEAECALRRTLKTGKPIIGKSCYIIDAEGRRIPISVSTAVLRDSRGQVVGGAETFRDLSEVEALRQELEGRFHIGEMISRSPAMRRVFDLATAVAASSSTVCIFGETGTGKELLARAIHAMSPRARWPFMAVNCGALPDTLLESELFGYRKGAFTGADQDRSGRLAAADHGTLFLDEIGEISPAFQVRLLRVLQERRYEPLGANASEPLNARVIVATNRDLEALVDQGQFRRDLYYRIHVIASELPPLRRRLDDIPLLVERFLERFNQMQNRHIAGLTPEALAILMAHHWPGNVRELENVMERAFVVCSEKWIDRDHLPDALTGRRGTPADAIPPSSDGEVQEGATPSPMAAVRRMSERETLIAALERAQGNRQAAARALGIHKTTLYRKVKALGITPPERDGRMRRPVE